MIQIKITGKGVIFRAVRYWEKGKGDNILKALVWEKECGIDEANHSGWAQDWSDKQGLVRSRGASSPAMVSSMKAILSENSHRSKLTRVL